MSLDAFLLSEEQAVNRCLRLAWQAIGGSQLVLCSDLRSAVQMLTHKHFDAVLLDFDLPGAATLIEAMRGAKSNKRSVCFALTKTSANGLPVQFILQKPLSTEHATRAFKAAYGMMAQEHRRYFRYPANLTVFVMVNKVESKLLLEDVSKGGMAVRTTKALPTGAMVRFRFHSPDLGFVKGEAGVIWSTSQRAGLKFSLFEAESQQRLERWLSAQEI